LTSTATILDRRALNRALLARVAKSVTRALAEEGGSLLAFAAKHAVHDIRIAVVDD